MSKEKNVNVVWQNAIVTANKRAAIKNHLPAVLWFTGLPGAGKSTLANALESSLHDRGYHTMLLDGDNIRHGLCKDLRFSETDRKENIRRIAEVARLFVDAGLIVITAFISPFEADRQMAKAIIGADCFYDIYCDCPLESCEMRDPKGHYQKARQGLIQEFTGVSSPYEIPKNPAIIVNTRQDIDSSLQDLLSALKSRRIIR